MSTGDNESVATDIADKVGIDSDATMWEAIFTDVGVAILTIFNSIRILNK